MSEKIYTVTADANGNAILQIDDVGTFYVNASIDTGINTALSETKVIDIEQNHTIQSVTFQFASITIKTLVGITISATNGLESFSFVTSSTSVTINVNPGYWTLSTIIDGVTKTIHINVKYYQNYNCSLPAQIVTRTMDFQANTSVLDTSEGTIEDMFPFVGRRRCNLADDGTINAWYGDSDYVEDGTNGQVMVYQPKFWYKMTPITLEDDVKIRKASWSISDTELDGYKLHPAFYDEDGNEVDYILIGAFKACIYDVSESKYITRNDVGASFTAGTGDKLSSICNAQPSSAGTRSDCRIIAENRGAGWHQNNIRVASMNQMMMIVEYGGNMQTLVGQGVVNVYVYSSKYNNSSLTGSTHGNGTGRASSTISYQNGGYTQPTYSDNDKTSTCYRGMEDPWGNIYEFIDGINMYEGQPYIALDYKWEENKNTENYVSCGFAVSSSSYSGYISAFGYNETYDWLFIGVEHNGSNSDMIGDYQSFYPGSSTYYGVLLGGYWDDGLKAGAFNMISCGSSEKYRYYGSRTTYVPQYNRS